MHEVGSHEARRIGRSILVLAIVGAFVLTTGLAAVLAPAHSARAAAPLGEARPYVVLPATSVMVGTNPTSVAYDSARGEIFVANSGSDNVSVINDSTNLVVASVGVGSNPYSLAYDPANGTVFVANEMGGSLSVINDTTNTVVQTVTLGSYPIGLAYDSALDEMFVSNDQTGVFVVNAATYGLVATVPAGNITSGLAYDPANGNVYVTLFDDGTVQAISDSSNTVTSTIAVGMNPGLPAYDSVTGDIYVPNPGSSNVSVIDGSTNTVVATVQESSAPDAAAFDPALSADPRRELGLGKRQRDQRFDEPDHVGEHCRHRPRGPRRRPHERSRVRGELPVRGRECDRTRRGRDPDLLRRQLHGDGPPNGHLLVGDAEREHAELDDGQHQLLGAGRRLLGPRSGRSRATRRRRRREPSPWPTRTSRSP